MQEMRTVDPDEFARWLRAESRAHGNRLAHDPEALRPHFDLDRTVAVFEDGNIIGGSNSHLLEMSIPGGSSVLAGVSNVAVQPTHTRQGLMTRMLRYQFNDFHERGEPLSALFASESSIYGRFGYGVGSVHEQWKIERRYNAYARPYETLGRMVFIEPEDITKELPEVFRRSTSDRPGVFQRAPHKWEEDSQAPEHRQGGRGGLFYVAYEDGGRIEGYATYRTSGPSLTVNELMATTKEATAALWRFCFDVDLVTSTEALKRPVDDPIPWMLADPRRLQRFTRDGMWLRVVDVAASLEQRRYMVDDRLVLEVRDDLCPWNDGRFELEGSPEGATCRATTASPDLAIAVSGLASTYLGAASFSSLAPAGLVDEHTPGALLRADRMFSVQYRPWTPHNF
jgi:predicted acetyltransferase